MTRFFKISILTMLCVVLVAGTAMAAGSITSEGGTNIVIALEAMNAARTYSLPGATNEAAGAVAITTSQSLNTSQSLTVTFSNIGFLGDIVSLCEITNATDGSSNGSVVVGQATTTAKRQPTI